MTVLFHPEVNRHWPKRDFDFVVDMATAGVSTSVIASILDATGRPGTTDGAVQAKIFRLRKCGLVGPPNPRRGTEPEPDAEAAMVPWADEPRYFEDDPRAVESAR